MSDDSKGVWVYLQHDSAGLTVPSLELIAAGRSVADKLGQELVGVILGSGLDKMADAAVQRGADRVILVDSQDLETYLNLAYADAIYSLVKERKPYVLLITANEVGKDIAGRVAYRVPTGLATDNVQLAVEDYSNPVLGQFKDLLIQVRPDFGTRLARIYTPRHRPQMATVRPGSFTPLEPDPKRKGKVEKVPFKAPGYPAKVTEVVELPPPTPDLAGADVVISLGLGVLKDRSGSPKDPRDAYRLALDLKSAFETRGMKAEIGATRALIYAELKELEGIIGKNNQVGQTGATVKPKVYVAAGISGALQHRVGMQNSTKIVAINTDPGAPIFKIAHYPVVGDLYEELPKLAEAVRRGAIAG
ncbi:MAG: electron transfer flavoprotein subunit alpha/FixB family protein [Nitrososphaerota archaeon]|nr:electron transfer flavoprotein subunit alpha/FixB family protein [Nitrososphaerota archaeon]MDG7018638.1 electron transfer flavoprotein subunit alpha/FixB family protein [Nitrososphaerota archaeon]MDG7020076.1 electron transfer flavoprotein subunit alpha/FixB family protein [Nitrososphaerota archaeon]